MKRLASLGVAAGIVFVLGCINIPKKFEAHITVDIRHHIEQQATSTLDFIEGKTDSIKPEPVSLAPAPSMVDRVICALSPVNVAYAQDLKTTSPTVTQIATRMRERFDEVQRLKSAGLIGETNRGYLDIRSADKIAKPDEKNAIQKSIAAENKDRKELYQEVARINRDQNVSVSMVEGIYALQRFERAKAGEIFQLPAQGPDYDAFMKTKTGQRLASKASPGAWVVVP
jgi:uncharacterized protein YdbL (DUF1318 family)